VTVCYPTKQNQQYFTLHRLSNALIWTSGDRWSKSVAAKFWQIRTEYI